MTYFTERDLKLIQDVIWKIRRTTSRKWFSIKRLKALEIKIDKMLDELRYA